jgi:hypothetical protein
MTDIIIETVFGLSLFLSIVLAFTLIIMKIYFQLKYQSLVSDQAKELNKKSVKEESLNISGLFELIAPIFIRNKTMELENINIKRTGKKVRILIFLFYFCLTYFLIAVNIK